jgi:hypothetical protein
MKFYLGSHHPSWLETSDAPLFLSRRTLAGRRSLPRASASWALDSGGFTELLMHGAWTLSARDYAAEVRRFRDEIGRMDWASPQDWMCESVMLAKTGLTIAEHQRRTVANFLELRTLAPDLPIIPVLQGWTLGNYLDHVDAYARAGVDLVAEPLVGLGSVCRRQNTARASIIVRHLADDGLRLHGFGFKKTGLLDAHQFLVSADSMAWSYHARREPPLPDCIGRHKSCSNCAAFALEWRGELLSSLERDEEQGRAA